MEKRTVDDILKNLQNEAESAKQLNPELWIDYAQILATLIGDEQTKLLDLQQEVAILKVAFIRAGDSVAMAKAKVEAMDKYKEMKQQEAKIKRIEEIIRIAKIHARLSQGI